MKKHRQTVDQNLVRAQRRWKWLRFLRDSSIIGLVLCSMVLLLGAAILERVIVRPNLALAIAVGLGFGGLCAWVAMLVRVLVGAPGRASVAAEVERSNPAFQDRLNTLVSLEKSAVRPESRFFLKRIAEQARRVLLEKRTRAAFSAERSVLWLAGFVTVLACTIWFSHRYQPWQRLRSPDRLISARANSPTKKPELNLPQTNALEQPANWGEVRITDPGTDLKLTKVDVVPLSIEAAANQDLQQVQWCSSINGAEEQKHELPAPREPRYALYQPTVYLDELELSDWDVLTYYAKAETRDHHSYGSQVYFIEVRPFREDIAKIPGGVGGAAYNTLNDISSLVGRQQQVIRDTHQLVQRPPVQDPVREKTRNGLSESETDLGKAAQHLYAEMVAKMENKPIGPALDSLAQAQVSLGQASAKLRDSVMDQAQNHERAALAQLIAVRKIFQKAVTDHPDDFNQPQNGQQPAVADSSSKLNEMAEFRDESKSAEEFVQKTWEQQKEVEKQAAPPMQEGSALAGQEQRLGKQLNDFAGEHPRAFKGLENQTTHAQQSLQTAEERFRGSAPDASDAAREATRSLDQLRSAMQSRTAGQQMADTYRLKRMLDEKARALGQLSKPEAGASAEDLNRTAGSAQFVLQQLKKNVDEQAAVGAFGGPLHDALNDQRKTAADEALSRIQQAQSERERRQQAQAAAWALEKISSAFAASQPKALQEARQKDALQPDAGSGLAAGMNQLKSLLRQLNQDRKPSSADQAKQGRQALANLRAGLRDQQKADPSSADLLQQLENMFAADRGLDPVTLKQLLDQLQKASVEGSWKTSGKPLNSEVARIDPTTLPPVYRSRIERYFQKLSEE